MRNALLISSLLFIAVSCKRDDDRVTRDRTAMEDTTGSRVGAGEPGASDQPGRITTPDTTGGTGTTGDIDRPGGTGTAPPGGTQPPAGTATTGDMDRPGGTAGTAPPSDTAGPGGTGTTGDMGQPSTGGTQPPSGTAGTGGAQPPGGTAGTGDTQPPAGTAGTAGTGTTGDMGQPGAGGTAQPGGIAGTGGTAPSMAAMTCDQLIPSTVRDQFLRDAKITSTGGADSNVANCRAEGGDLTSAVNITADCATTGARSPADLRRENPSGRVVENVGKAAVITETGSTKQLTALDDDSNCRIDVSVPQNVDAVAIGRAMLDKLPGKG